MKNIKNILTISLLAILLGGIKIASADTFSMSYMSSSGGLLTAIVDYGLNKDVYNVGETIYPSQNGMTANLRCANGVSYSGTDKIYAAMVDFKIGRPGSSLIFKEAVFSGEGAETPWAYIAYVSDSDAKNVYLRDGTYVFNVLDQISHHYSYEEALDLISDNQILNVEENGDVYITHPRYAWVGNWEQLGLALWEESISGRHYSTQISEYANTIQTVSLRTVTSYHRGVATTPAPVFNSPALPGSVLIPGTAEGGSYVAQVTFHPAWGGKPATPTYSKYGAWVDATTVTYKTCPDGSKVASTEVCPSTKTCPDGSVVASTAICPITSTKTCPDGSVIPSTQVCPTITYKTCWDGSRIPSDDLCPASKTCPDGTVTGINMVCPKKLLPPIEPEMMYFFENILGINTANARIQEARMEFMELNGGGGGSGTGGTSTPPPTCGSAWWCTISLYSVPISVSFTVNNPNTSPSILIK